jgi:hypothetical protein
MFIAALRESAGDWSLSACVSKSLNLNGGQGRNRTADADLFRAAAEDVDTNDALTMYYALQQESSARYQSDSEFRGIGPEDDALLRKTKLTTAKVTAMAAINFIKVV